MYKIFLLNVDKVNPLGTSCPKNNLYITFFNIARYDKLVAEGHDARLFRFSKPDDETINGGHSDPKNKEYWQVGCMGITG